MDENKAYEHARLAQQYRLNAPLNPGPSVIPVGSYAVTMIVGRRLRACQASVDDVA
jgi:hypothetical protein